MFEVNAERQVVLQYHSLQVCQTGFLFEILNTNCLASVFGSWTKYQTELSLVVENFSWLQT